ncbi:hypothetical protein NEIRO03_0830 [Nematocida sp. AWRm78]|nr:hypothetical protein NEIRO02_0756 [Nematocida sp. AWRm79]KAI5183212.1 hypothetical protein NEIRO03_0830 [Nematocida sp. AWRm78]
MRCSKNSPFVFTNALTRCLNVLDGARSSPPLIREILANIARNKELVGPVMKILTSEDTLRKHGKQKLLQMVLAIWTAIPEMAAPQKVLTYLSALDNTPLARILLLKTALSLLKIRESSSELDMQRLFDILESLWKRHGTEADYLIISIFIEMLDTHPEMKPRVHHLMTNQPPSMAVALIPKMIFLSLQIEMPYTVPSHIFSANNMSAYIRVLDAILVVCAAYPKEKVFSMFPDLTSTIKMQISNFINKEVHWIEYNMKHDRKTPFTYSMTIQKIKDVLSSPEDPRTVVQTLKTLLNISEGMPAL